MTPILSQTAIASGNILHQIYYISAILIFALIFGIYIYLYHKKTLNHGKHNKLIYIFGIMVSIIPCIASFPYIVDVQNISYLQTQTNLSTSMLLASISTLIFFIIKSIITVCLPLSRRNKTLLIIQNVVFELIICFICMLVNTGFDLIPVILE